MVTGLLIALGLLALIALIIALYPVWHSKRLLYLLTSLFIIGLPFAYLQWGGFSGWRHYLYHQKKQKQIAELLQSIKSPTELIDRLKASVEAHPERAQGWFLLGRLYASQGDWLRANDAFKKAYDINPKNEAFSINYAQSLWQLNQHHFNSQIRTLLKEVLQRNPKQADALAWLAMDALDSHHEELAIQYWQTLLSMVDPSSKEALLIRKAIAKAQKQRRSRD